MPPPIRGTRRLRLFGACLLLMACEAPSPAARHAPSTAAAYFPSAVGDRWRERVGETSRTVGVTGRTAEGLLVVFGTHDRRASFYRVDDGDVSLVRPDGTTLEPLLRGPLRPGASFEYTSGQGPLAAPCTARITRTGLRYRVGPIDDCLELERECRHPRGGLFPTPTTRRSTETWCPAVGRVVSTMTLDPPLPDATPAPTTRVVAYVTGARRARPDGCDGALLLESDVAAACGAGWSLTSETSAETSAETAAGAGCTAHFSRGQDTLDVRLGRADDEPAAPGASTVRGEVDGRAWSISATGCPTPQLERLRPLVRSLMQPG